MNREDIVHMVREAGAMFDRMPWVESDLALIFERFADLVAAKKEKQIIDILRRLQEQNDSHNYYAYAINVIKGEA